MNQFSLAREALFSPGHWIRTHTPIGIGYRVEGGLAQTFLRAENGAHRWIIKTLAGDLVGTFPMQTRTDHGMLVDRWAVLTGSDGVHLARAWTEVPHLDPGVWVVDAQSPIVRPMQPGDPCPLSPALWAQLLQASSLRSWLWPGLAGPFRIVPQSAHARLHQIKAWEVLASAPDPALRPALWHEGVFGVLERSHLLPPNP